MQEVTLTITMGANGQVGVSGPIENLVLCYGMLERAKDAIRDHAKQQAAGPQILVPTPRLMPNGRH